MYASWKWTATLGALALAGVTLLAPVDAAAKGIKIRQALVATGGDPDASGQLKADIRPAHDGLRGKLEVRAGGLAPRTTYDVTLDGVRIGSFTTGRNGAGKATFDTRPRGNKQLLGVDPRGMVAAVVAGDGSVVLQTTVSDATMDPDKVRCCLPDDSGPECEDRTAAECAAAGGVDLGAGSCLPNPCSSGPPPVGGDIRCCIPDDSGPECEDRTPEECSAQGGVNIGAGSCAPNPCLQGGTTPTTLPGSATVRVTCERRSDRSKVSVDGNNLAVGSYSARVTSGGNVATAGPQASTGDEFEFDSERDDIAAGATPIAPNFIQGATPQVTGEIIDAGGAVVAQATVTCRIH